MFLVVAKDNRAGALYTTTDSPDVAAHAARIESSRADCEGAAYASIQEGQPFVHALYIGGAPIPLQSWVHNAPAWIMDALEQGRQRGRF